MKKLIVLGIALFFCLFFVGCSWVTTPPIILDNGGMDEYDSQFISLLDKLKTPLKLLNFLSTCHYKEHDGAYTPYEFYIGKEGDCVDFSISWLFGGGKDQESSRRFAISGYLMMSWRRSLRVLFCKS